MSRALLLLFVLSACQRTVVVFPDDGDGGPGGDGDAGAGTGFTWAAPAVRLETRPIDAMTIAQDQAGNLALLYTTQEVDNFSNVFYRIRYAGAPAWTSAHLAADRDDQIVTLPHVAAWGSGSDPSFLMAWTVATQTYACAYLAGNGRCLEPTPLLPTPLAVLALDLAVNDQGAGIAAWVQYDANGSYEVDAARFDPNSGLWGSWSAPERIGDAVLEPEVRVAITTGGRSFVLWSGYGMPATAAVREAGGSATWSTPSAWTGTATNLQLVALPGEGAFAAWLDIDQLLQTAWYAAAGWDATATAPPVLYGSVNDFAVAAAGTQVLVAASLYDTTHIFHIYTSLLDPGTHAGTPRLRHDTGVHTAADVALSSDKVGDLLAAWIQPDDAATGLFLSTSFYDAHAAAWQAPMGVDSTHTVEDATPRVTLGAATAATWLGDDGLYGDLGE